ncbi:MAG: flagellar basal body P-ring formation protein FlgA [Planctomycetes bacterium]|jgi:flagella basal body P-ring formation protein FlgA|nr:flagellar basal body P-ring formation protein FlgA [Planctomycetota bacterium]
MTTRTLKILLILLIPLTMLATHAFGEDADATADAPEPAVRVYLPRSRTVDKASLTVDDVAFVSGRNNELAGKVKAVAMGRSPFPGESITVNRQTLLSQLAAANLPTDTLRIIGAEQTVIDRKATEVTTDDIITAATTFLKASKPAGVTSWELATRPKDISMPARDGARVRCRFAKQSPSGQVHIHVLLATNADVLAERLVVFRVKYQAKQLVAARDISPGEPVTPDNTTMETVQVTQPPDEVYLPPFGKRARVRIQAGARITDSCVHEPKPELTIRRNQTVRMRIQGDGWSVTALGKALQNGRAGETIRVRNLDSRRIIVGEIDKHGNVIPMMTRPEVAAAKERTP